MILALKMYLNDTSTEDVTSTLNRWSREGLDLFTESNNLNHTFLTAKPTTYIPQLHWFCLSSETLLHA